MNKSIKIILLVVAILLAVGGIMAYYKTIVSPPGKLKFKNQYVNSDKIIPLLKPRTNGANISPFSSKNLPRNNEYRLPDEALNNYKEIIQNVPQNKLLSINVIQNSFIKTLASKKHPLSELKADMRLKGLRGKEYIHSIGKWDKYIKYLKENL